MQKVVLKRTGGRPETIHTDMIELAFGSNASLAVAPMQDFLGLGSEARINTPGTTKDNWRWRMQEGQIDGRLAEQVAAMVHASSRAP
jgi:4-alpha-glucanotransferase